MRYKVTITREVFINAPTQHDALNVAKIQNMHDTCKKLNAGDNPSDLFVLSAEGGDGMSNHPLVGRSIIDVGPAWIEIDTGARIYVTKKEMAHHTEVTA